MGRGSFKLADLVRWRCTLFLMLSLIGLFTVAAAPASASVTAFDVSGTLNSTTLPFPSVGGFSNSTITISFGSPDSVTGASLAIPGEGVTFTGASILLGNGTLLSPYNFRWTSGLDTLEIILESGNFPTDSGGTIAATVVDLYKTANDPIFGAIAGSMNTVLSPNPEPATMLLFGTGLLVLASVLQRAHRRTKR